MSGDHHGVQLFAKKKAGSRKDMLRALKSRLFGAKSFHCVRGARERMERRRGKLGDSHRL